MSRSRSILIALAITTLLMGMMSGCVGELGNGPAGPDGVGPGPTTPEMPEPIPRPRPDGTCEAGDAVGRPVLRRLTGDELEATIRDVFALDRATWGGPTTPPDPAAANGLPNAEDRLRATETWTERMLETAEAVAEIVSRDPVLGRVSSCGAGGGAGNEACARELVDRYGRRLFRRSLEDDERARYLAMYARVAPELGFAGFVRVATIAMLMSPHVAWRTELGDVAGAGRTLRGAEIATELAFTYTGRAPSAELLDRAERGELDTAEARIAAARELALDASGAPRPEAHTQYLRFTQAWLGTSGLPNSERDATLYAGFSREVRTSMQRELDAFVTDVVFTRGGDTAELFTSPTTFVDATLSSWYGLPGATSDALTEVERPEGRGVGLLAEGALLTVYANAVATSPTRRGHFVRRRILCGAELHPPPAVPDLPPASAARTTRERYESLHAAEATCAGCHQLMDPIGFGMESLDAAGRFRELENGYPIDDSGRIVASSRGDVDFDDQEALAALLASLPETEACYTAFVASWSYGVSDTETPCLAHSALGAMRADGGGMLDAWLGLAGTAHFAARQ